MDQSGGKPRARSSADEGRAVIVRMWLLHLSWVIVCCLADLSTGAEGCQVTGEVRLESNWLSRSCTHTLNYGPSQSLWFVVLGWLF